MCKCKVGASVTTLGPGSPEILGNQRTAPLGTGSEFLLCLPFPSPAPWPRGRVLLSWLQRGSGKQVDSVVPPLLEQSSISLAHLSF